MLTIEGVQDFLRGVIAEGRLEGQTLRLRDAQRAAALLMRAAEEAGDETAARSFRLLAAQAANDQEELQDDEA